MNLLKLSSLLSVLLTAPHFCSTTVFAAGRLSSPQLSDIREEINRDNSPYLEAFQQARSKGESASYIELLAIEDVNSDKGADPDKGTDFVYRATLRYHNFVPRPPKLPRNTTKKSSDRHVDVQFNLTQTTESDLKKGLNHLMLWFPKFLNNVEIEVKNNFNDALWYGKSTTILQNAISWSRAKESADCNGILTKVSVQMSLSKSQNEKMLKCFVDSYEEIKKYAQAG